MAGEVKLTEAWRVLDSEQVPICLPPPQRATAPSATVPERAAVTSMLFGVEDTSFLGTRACCQLRAAQASKPVHTRNPVARTL